MDLSPLLAALDTLVLERLPEGTFVRRGVLPGWCLALPQEAVRGEAPFDIEDAFPFLSVFLEQAEGAWRSGGAGRVDSDFWTEVGAGGEEIHLEASAVRVGPSAVLVLTQNNRLFLQQRMVLQRARELRLVHDELMRELELKDILIHAIVHDLASPLHSILGALSLLEEQAPGGSSKQWIQIALQAAARQRQLVKEILDVFSAEKAGLVQAPEVTDEAPDVSRVIAQVMEEMEPIARQRGIRLSADLGAPGARVLGEETRLFRVLTNLVGNALRYSPAGGVVLLATRPADGAVRIAAEDQGPGVPVEMLPRLFEKLAPGGARGGTGLGLYFCRITVERWGGGIGYEPRPGGGARFWIRLPLSGPARGGPWPGS